MQVFFFAYNMKFLAQTYSKLELYPMHVWHTDVRKIWTCTLSHFLSAFTPFPLAGFFLLESVTRSPSVSWIQPHEGNFLFSFYSVLTLHVQFFSDKSFCVIMLKHTLLLLSFHWVTNSKKNICCQRLNHLQRKWCCSNAKVLMNSCSCQGRVYIWIIYTHEAVWLSI